MSWLFSQALVAEYSAASCSGGEPFAPLSVMPTQHKFWHRGKTMDALSLSRFGLTCAVLTEDLGRELLTWFLAASRARTSAAPGKAKDSTASGRDSGAKWPGSLARFDRDSLSWRTPQCSLFEDSEPCLETWPRWGLMRDGECWEQQMSAHRINETESGSELIYPTPTASMMPCEGTVRIMRKAWINGEITLEEVSAIAGRDVRKAQGKVKEWPTPDANCGQRGTQPEWTPKRKSGQPAQYTINQAVRDKEGTPGKLNPMWVEWLMGWPLGWTDLKPLGMDKFREWQLQHSPCFLEGREAA